MWAGECEVDVSQEVALYIPHGLAEGQPEIEYGNEDGSAQHQGAQGKCQAGFFSHSIAHGDQHRAWEELYIAEGSDWFWWFGDSHSSAQDGLFDRLFRKHLQNVYAVLGEQPPSELTRPIRQGHRHTQSYIEPTGLLSVKVDGRRSYFEWINAGHYLCGGSRGTMSMVTQGYISDLYFGFDTERLLLRLDARGGPLREQLADVQAIRLVFLQPEGFELIVVHPSRKEPELQLWRHGMSVAGSHGMRL